MRKLFLMGVLLALLAVGMPAAAQDKTSARFEPSDCPFDVPVGEKPTCGYLIVPEDRSQPDGKTIKIAAAVFRSKAANKLPDPVIYLDGGPGSSTLKSADFALNTILGGFRNQRDVILFDQRGVGLSQPALDCSELVDVTYQYLDVPLSTDENLKVFSKALADCHDRLAKSGINLAAYTSAANAADVNDLRIALGYDKLNLVGISYGTRLALTILRDHPEAVRSAIIDSVLPLQASGFDIGTSAQRAFKTVFDGCAADAICNATYPNLEAVFNKLVDSLNANPVEIQFADDRSGKTLKAMVDGDTMVGLFFQGLYITQAIPLMPKAIYSANNGVYNFLSAMLSIQLSQLDYISYGMYYSVQCSEEYPFDTPETVMAMLKQLPPQLVGFARRGLVDPIQFSVCQMWGTKPPAPIENQPVTSDVPTLVMSGEYDPITPPDYGKAAAATLKNSFFFQFPGLGHGTIPSDVCPRSIALAFVDNPTAKPDAACIASMREPSFSSG